MKCLLYKKRILLALLCGIAAHGLKAQPNQSFTIVDSLDKVTIYYKWERKFPYVKDNDRNLVLYIQNRNDKNVSVSFSIDIFVRAFVYSTSGMLTYCLPPNYELTGRFRHLAFDTGLSWPQIQSDTVTWNIDELKVQACNQDCKPQMDWLKVSK